MSRRDEVIEVARELLEEGSPDGITMQAIADRLEIRSPSLYKHVRNKRDVEIALISRGFADQATAFADATLDQSDPVAAIAHSYRRWALANPHLYTLMTANPVPRDELDPDIEAAAAAPLVDALGGDLDSARALWAFAHGMVSLELAGRFPDDADLDTAWTIGITALGPER